MTSQSLFGVLCSQAAYYYRTYPQDHVFMRVVVNSTPVVVIGSVTVLSYIPAGRNPSVRNVTIFCNRALTVSQCA